MDRFLAVGGLQQDFRKEGAQETADIPAPVREVESLVEEGKGEKCASFYIVFFSGNKNHKYKNE